MTFFTRFRQSSLAARLTLLLAVALVLLVAGYASARAASDQSPALTSLDDVTSLYGDGIEFGIYRNGSPVGTHRVRFAEADDGLKVTTEFDLKVGALFVTLYRFDYESNAVWQDGKLVNLTARTDQNGTVANVVATAEGDELKVTGPNGPYEAPVGVYPTNHWNAGVIGSTQVLNTITGRVTDVRLVPKGTEAVETAHGVVEATRYQYEGGLDNQVWYDARGRWVKMRFPGPDGSSIELRCKQCKATDVADVDF